MNHVQLQQKRCGTNYNDIVLACNNKPAGQGKRKTKPSVAENTTEATEREGENKGGGEKKNDRSGREREVREVQRRGKGGMCESKIDKQGARESGKNTE